MVSDQFKASWQQHFASLLHSRSPELATLIETADKLAIAQGYLEPLSSDVDIQCQTHPNCVQICKNQNRPLPIRRIKA